MRWVPAGTFAMGSEDFYPEERPVHRVELDGFWIDEHPVGLWQLDPLPAWNQSTNGDTAALNPRTDREYGPSRPPANSAR